MKSEPTIIHLYPHRSLSKRAFMLLMGCIALVSFVAGVAFLLVGAWPVFGFFGLDVLLIWWAFRHNFKDGEHLESITIDQTDLIVERHRPGKPKAIETFVRQWTRVELEVDEDRELIGKLFLVSKGLKTEIGSFLSPDDRQTLSRELRSALAVQRI